MSALGTRDADEIAVHGLHALLAVYVVHNVREAAAFVCGHDPFVDVDGEQKLVVRRTGVHTS